MRGHLRKFEQNPMPHNAHIGTITADEFAQNFSSFWHEPEEDAESGMSFKPGTLINSLSRGDSAIIGTTIKATPTIGGGLLNSPRHSHRSRGRKPKFGARRGKKYETLRPLAQKRTGGTTSFPKFGLDEADRMFDWIDPDGSGTISLEEMRLALEYYVGSQFQEDQLKRLQEMMSLKKMSGIPKDMFIQILKNILSRIGRSDTRKKDPASAEKKRSSRPHAHRADSTADEVVLKGFAVGLGITSQSLEEKLTKEIADKEELATKIAQLRKLVQHEKLQQRKLLSNMDRDQSTLELQNKGLREANERLTEQVDKVADELENTKMVVLELYERANALEKNENSLRQQLNDAQAAYKETSDAYDNLQEKWTSAVQELRTLRSGSISQARTARQRSQSQTALTTEMVRQKKVLEANLKLAKDELKEMKRKMRGLHVALQDNRRMLQASKASAEFWKNQVSPGARGKGVNLAEQIAQLATSQRVPGHLHAGSGSPPPVTDTQVPPVTEQPEGALRPPEHVIGDTQTTSNSVEFEISVSRDEGTQGSQDHSRAKLLGDGTGGTLEASDVELDNLTSPDDRLNRSGSLLSASLSEHWSREAKNAIKGHKEQLGMVQNKLRVVERRAKDYEAKLKSSEARLEQARRELEAARMAEPDEPSSRCCFCG